MQGSIVEVMAEVAFGLAHIKAYFHNIFHTTSRAHALGHFDINPQQSEIDLLLFKI